MSENNRSALAPRGRKDRLLCYERCARSGLAANLADLELHTFLHRAPAIDRPTELAFDLDSGAPADILLCCQVGLWSRFLKTWGCNPFRKLLVQKACNYSFRSIEAIETASSPTVVTRATWASSTRALYRASSVSWRPRRPCPCRTIRWADRARLWEKAGSDRPGRTPTNLGFKYPSNSGRTLEMFRTVIIASGAFCFLFERGGVFK